MAHRGLAWTTAGLLTGLLVSGCPAPGSFNCQSDAECLFEGQQGECTAVGYCAFESEECGSGLAYGELSAPALAGTCVPGGSGSGEDGSTPSTSTPASTTARYDSTGGPGGDSTGTPDCSPGEPCVTADPCDSAGVCDVSGACVPEQDTPCSSPPGPCFLPVGECTPKGCVYVARSRQSPCDDGDPCTEGDFCDDGGECIPGARCESNDPCQVASCEPEGCVIRYLRDGESCGEGSWARCCDRRCVDISRDEDHCGGCYTRCAMGENCQSTDTMGTCEQGEANVSGRCTCAAADDDCPNMQTCQIVGASGSGLCEPDDASECHGTLEAPMDCPNYCSY